MVLEVLDAMLWSICVPAVPGTSVICFADTCHVIVSAAGIAEEARTSCLVNETFANGWSIW